VFTKKKIIMLSVVCLIFALGEYWIFSTIKNTFEKNTLKEMKALVKAMTSFAPSNNEALSDWIEELGAIYSDNRFFVIKGSSWRRREVKNSAEMTALLGVTWDSFRN